MTVYSLPINPQTLTITSQQYNTVQSTIQSTNASETKSHLIIGVI